MAEATTALGKLQPELGRILHIASSDQNGRRLVLREHEFGMTRSLLEYRADEKRFRTIAHAVRMFK